MGRGHYANTPLPFHGPHATEYVSPNGGREPSAYRHAHLYNSMPANVGAGPSTQESTKRSAGAAVARPEVITDPSDLPVGDIADTSGA